MKRKIALLLLVGMGTAILLIPFLQVGMALSLSQPEYPSCNSFGIQRFQERKQAPAFSLEEFEWGTNQPQRLQRKTGSHHLLGYLV